MIKCIKFGMFMLLFNMVLEFIISVMVSGLFNVSVYFLCFIVMEILLCDQVLGQFDLEKILNVVKLLVDVYVDVIVWNGMLFGWFGFEKDEVLCCQIMEVIGILVIMFVLVFNEILVKIGVCDFVFVMLYLDDVQQCIVQNYVCYGFNCVVECYLDLYVNYSFVDVEEDMICSLVCEVVQKKLVVIIMFCMNLCVVYLVEVLEVEMGILVYDIILIVVWKLLWLVGVDMCELCGWGCLFVDVV